MYLQQAKDQFNNIAEKTGILSSKKKVEPSHKERDLLWDITG
jgi:hypothetical protein